MLTDFSSRVSRSQQINREVTGMGALNSSESTVVSSLPFFSFRVVGRGSWKPPTWSSPVRRYLTVSVSVLCVVCSGSVMRAQSGQLTVYTAKNESGRVELRAFAGAQEIPVDPKLARTSWHSFGLRRPSPNAPRRPDAVTEVHGDLPRIQVRQDYQIIAYSSFDDTHAQDKQYGDKQDEEKDKEHEEDDQASQRRRGGLAALGPWGTRILLEAGGTRYRPEGAFVSPDGQSLAIMFHGSDGEELFLVQLDAEFPTVKPVGLPRTVTRLEPGSLTLIEAALFFVARAGGK